MKNLIYIFLVGFTAAIISSCSEDHFDVNVPSNAVDVEDLRMSDLLAPVIHSTIEGQHSVSQSFSNYSQYMVGQGGTAVGRTTAAGLWSQVYLYVLPNIDAIKMKAEQEQANYYRGIADVLTAANLGIATDTWDNIPYSESSLGIDNTSPAFDEQQTIYQEIFTLLDQAIASMNQMDDSGQLPGNDDLIYGGDIDRWIRAAYTLKARYQLRLMSKGLLSPSEVIASVSNGFTSNDDDFEMFYNDRGQNPWYSVEVVARSTGNYHNDIAEQFVSSLNGDYFPFEDEDLDEDPRLRVFIDNDFDPDNIIPEDIEWKGFVSGGQGLAADGTEGNTYFVGEGYYTSITSPIPLITYAEAEFIRAEAEFFQAGGTTTSTGTSSAAYNAYIRGIQASMDRYGVDGSEYLEDDSVDVGESNLKLEHIMKEKYIHNFLNPETFSDFRRYDFSDDVFRGLEIREEGDEPDPEFAGQWFRRADYPESERNRNSENVAANEQPVTAPVWWDE